MPTPASPLRCSAPRSPWFARSWASLAGTVVPSVMLNSITASAGRVWLAAAAAAAPPGFAGAGTCVAWCLPTSRCSCRPGSGLSACAAAAAAAPGVCLNRTSTWFGTNLAPPFAAAAALARGGARPAAGAAAASRQAAGAGEAARQGQVGHHTQPAAEVIQERLQACKRRGIPTRVPCPPPPTLACHEQPHAWPQGRHATPQGRHDASAPWGRRSAEPCGLSGWCCMIGMAEVESSTDQLAGSSSCRRDSAPAATGGEVRRPAMSVPGIEQFTLVGPSRPSQEAAAPAGRPSGRTQQHPTRTA